MTRSQMSSDGARKRHIPMYSDKESAAGALHVRLASRTIPTSINTRCSPYEGKLGNRSFVVSQCSITDLSFIIHKQLGNEQEIRVRNRPWIMMRY